jgi:hypothetical protein
MAVMMALRDLESGHAEFIYMIMAAAMLLALSYTL